jgi:hypothetical protein
VIQRVDALTDDLCKLCVGLEVQGVIELDVGVVFVKVRCEWLGF